MNNNKYPLYAIAIVVGGGLAVWAGIPPYFLILLLACPLMMFVMMRGGMHGGHGESSHRGTQGSTTTPPADLDGAHEHIDRT